MALADILFSGTKVVLTTELSPPMEFDLSDAAKDGPPNPILAFLKPKVEVYRNGLLVSSQAPYGNPVPLDWWGWIALALLGVLVVLLLVKQFT